ncbi:serine/threonine protein kinase [Cladophialophora yegresii CBS 114405]|uniref:Serine/threonine protein kinase n=1 Tax=Cladophialophora yegresii CBS 114405 TaxID=1182544 RepID=W9W0E9_9EURO|nr:serine/threonine protein kinase [Cladophialophora yegresii CBS 114405]EXJ57976.1 serine/threonine protein kinase [Cladophialophora yegresii CBS 114405]
MGIRPHHAEPNALTPVDSEPHQHHSRHSLRLGMWQKLQHFFAKEDATQSPIECSDDEQWSRDWADRRDSNKNESATRPLAVGLPRQATFRRQNSERRDRLLPIQPGNAERRAVSSTRHASISLPRRRATSSPPNWDPARTSATSAPAVAVTARADVGGGGVYVDLPPTLDSAQLDTTEDLWPQDDHRPPRPPSRTSSDDSHYPQMPLADDKAELRDELDHRWILNLSMHFRDKSDREKFFVTYAQTPSFWRRVTISCDYRNAEMGSLEMDLKELQFQRDKSMQIYESIRDSLPEIQFYDTVTNLKLETTDGRLHVHVTEDVNEIIPYPPKTTVSHIFNDETFRPMKVREDELVFDSHLSGFVYKVLYKGRTYIKKEIPGPDTVDEFLYEINALHALHDSAHVIKLEAVVFDDTETLVKGLLISYADKGAIVDLLYDHRGSIAWEDRCRWAEQAVRGLSEIHEEGYVQGDFTLSNIVVDADGNAKIIDINRRGCPVGWEPPEIAAKIASNQRISMYIGEKSDIYQLGMTLWALAMDDDEPERHVPPLSIDEFPSEVPEWYQDIVRICLSPRPRDRLSAKELVGLFPVPEATSMSCDDIRPQQRPALKVRTMKKYIDPADAVERDDILRLGSKPQGSEAIPYSPESSRDDYTFTYPKSSNYEFESDLSGYDRPRGRRPPINYAHLGGHERHHWESEDERPTPTEDFEPNIVPISPGMDREFNELEMDGHRYLISRQTFTEEELKILERHAEAESSLLSQDAVDGEGPVAALTDSAPIPARRPSLLDATSDSTPRNSQDLLAVLATPWSGDQHSETRGVNDIGLYYHPTGPNDARNTPQDGVTPAADGDSDLLTRNHGTDLPKDKTRFPPGQEMTKPPSLPFADSGYDESLGYLVSSGDVEPMPPISDKAEPQQTESVMTPSSQQPGQKTDGSPHIAKQALLCDDTRLSLEHDTPSLLQHPNLAEEKTSYVDFASVGPVPHPKETEPAEKHAICVPSSENEHIIDAESHELPPKKGLK